MDDARDEQRNRWAAARGFVPNALRNKLTDAEAAAVAVHAAAAAKKGYHDLSAGQISWLSGVSESTVRQATRKIQDLGWASVENLEKGTTIVRIIAPEWLAMLRLIAGSGMISGEP